MRKTILITLTVILLLGLFGVAYFNSRYRQITRIFSAYTLLTSSWEKYKARFINNDGRVIDYTENYVTTSEGQSYAMLRAVWIDDKQAFDKVWKWTFETLKRPNDNLFGWRWGKLQNNKYGFIENGGINSAADADSDIALALIFASRKWGDKKYETRALNILNDLWRLETATTQNGKRYLIAGNWANQNEKLTINPSYFAPYAWRIFAQVDKKHNWNSLITPAYDLLMQSSRSKLDKNSTSFLPPDWIEIDKTTGQISSPSNGSFTTNYSFDAVRIPWRIALDYKWNKDKRAHDYLIFAFSRLEEYYKTNNRFLAISYAHDGKVINKAENPVMYATSIGYFMLKDPKIAEDIYETKILANYSNDTLSFSNHLSYYEQNWLWFGAALYTNQLGKFI